MKFLGDQEAWPDITKTLKNDKSRAACAIGYVGINAWRYLPLKEGDLLVCDASPTAIRRGLTNPKGLVPYLNAGVNVFSREGLHAKVITTSALAWIGSNNASDNSANNLIEAAVLVDNLLIVKAAREFIEEVKNFSTRVESSQIKEMSKLIPKRSGKGPVAVRNSREIPKKLDTLFLFRTVTMEKPSKEQTKAVASNIKEIRAKKNRSEIKSQLNWIFWEGRLSAKAGDWVVDLRGRAARSPAKIIDITGPVSDRIIWIARPEPKVTRVLVTHLEEVLDREISSANSSKLVGKEAKLVLDYFR